MGGGAKLLHEETKGHPFEVTNKLLRLAHSQAECLHKRRVVQGCALLLGGFLRRLAAWLQRRLVLLAVRRQNFEKLSLSHSHISSRMLLY